MTQVLILWDPSKEHKMSSAQAAFPGEWSPPPGHSVGIECGEELSGFFIWEPSGSPSPLKGSTAHHEFISPVSTV